MPKSSKVEKRSKEDMGSDLSWIHGSEANDPRALQEFYAVHFPAVRRYVLQNSGSKSDAEDVFQEAMMALWLNAKEGRVKQGGESNFGAYIFRIAKNKWLDQMRSARHRKTSTLSEKAQFNTEVEDEATEERIQELQRIYSNLDSKCKRVLDMFYYKKQDLRTIAAAIGVDEGSIRTMKYRCMMKLRKFHIEKQALQAGTKEQ